jgi:ParB-like chromosome segregation protein Spo0J
MFVIVAGECRYRAHQLLGLETIKAEVVEISEREMQLQAIVENMQRQDMNPMEEARAFKCLQDNGFTIAEIVEQLGLKGRERVQNRLALLDLVPDVQRLVESNTLTTSMASAIALAPSHHQLRLVREINTGALRTVDQIRHASQALRDAAAQLDAFASAEAASPKDVAAARALEQKIEAVARMVQSGFDEGRCVAALRVSKDRIKVMADKLTLIRKHVLQMEHQLRCVLAQLQLTASPKGRDANEDHQHQATVGIANRKRRQRRREPDVADNVSRPRPRSRLAAIRSDKRR